MSGHKRERPPHGSNHGLSKKPKVDPARLQQIKVNLQRKKQQENQKKDFTPTLNSISIHPLLRDDSSTTLTDSNENGKESTPPKHIPNPLKAKSRPGFTLNPYITQSSMALAPPRPIRNLQLNPKGKYIEQANQIREQMKLEREENLKLKKLSELNLVANEKRGEQYYRPVEVPFVEWWDKPLLLDKSYQRIDDESRLSYKKDDQNNPITMHIQHPVPISPSWAKHEPPPQPLYLTKRELKRLRKNARQEKFKNIQDKTKLGLLPTPKPKIKLKNLMNILTNESIKNPTEVEMKVKQEIKERERIHLHNNEERKITPEERHAKLKAKNERDLLKGFYSSVFKINRLVSAQHCFKVDINAKQLELTGLCIKLKDGISLIIVEGSEVSVSKYKKLMMNRIDWTENVMPKKKRKDDEIDFDSKEDPEIELENLSNNKCELLWQGQLSNLHFHKWTIYDFDDELDILGFLSKYKLENYWRQANNS